MMQEKPSTYAIIGIRKILLGRIAAVVSCIITAKASAIKIE